MSKHVGVIHQELFDLFLIDDGFNVPQKLAQIEKTAKKRFIEMSDVELHETIQKLRKEDYYQDQKLEEEEFNNWVDAK